MLSAPSRFISPLVRLALLSALFANQIKVGAQVLTSSTTSVLNPVVTTLAPTVTNIAVGSTVTRTGMKHVGMNIDSENFYDSGQMMKNLAFRNPGFEGETWQSILHCVSVTATTCTDSNPWAQWPNDFLTGGTFEFIQGTAKGQTGSITSMTAANVSNGVGVTVTLSGLSTAPAAGDWVVVRQTMPGNGTASWFISTWANGSVTTETTDLSPNTAGKQAVLLNASVQGQYAGLDTYFDSTNTHNFVLISGPHEITFRAKGVGGNNQLVVSVARQITNGAIFSQTVNLTPTWQDYTLTFTGAETASTATGTVDLNFHVSGGAALLDDVDLQAVTGSTNTTAFRDDVVTALAGLKPGVLRYMDGLPDFGSSIDNMIAPVSARVRTGSSTQQIESDDIAMGLNEFLQLCQTVGAEPWYNLPPGISTTEMQNLIQFFAGDASTPYGAKRAALGQTAPWTTVFPVIHLELGNEQWNYGTFPGNAINDPVAYGNRVSDIFTAAKNAPSYNATSFDLVMGSFLQNAWYTQQEIANATNFDSVSVAPYLFGNFSDGSSNEAIFGPMLAEPEMWDSTANGYMMQQAQAVAPSGKKLVVYEENISTQSGTASQAQINEAVPSVTAGVMMADHELLEMRDLGIQTQNVWAISGYQNQFNNTNGGTELSPVFGTTIDMGGQTNRKRPVYLATQLVNTAVLPNMLGTTLTGANPTWNQGLSANDSIQLNNAHYLQTFAFTDGAKSRSVVVVNLSRSSALPVTFSGANAPAGNVTISQLTSTNLTDSNESSATVATTSKSAVAFLPSVPYSLPPFSVTVFTWTVQ